MAIVVERGRFFGTAQFFLAACGGEALYEYPLGKSELKMHFREEFGRIRAVVLGPDGDFYLTTSNRDGRGTPRPGDDKLIRVNPRIFRPGPQE